MFSAWFPSSLTFAGIPNWFFRHNPFFKAAHNKACCLLSITDRERGAGGLWPAFCALFMNSVTAHQGVEQRDEIKRWSRDCLCDRLFGCVFQGTMDASENLHLLAHSRLKSLWRAVRQMSNETDYWNPASSITRGQRISGGQSRLAGKMGREQWWQLNRTQRCI